MLWELVRARTGPGRAYLAHRPLLFRLLGIFIWDFTSAQNVLVQKTHRSSKEGSRSGPQTPARLNHHLFLLRQEDRARPKARPVRNEPSPETNRMSYIRSFAADPDSSDAAADDDAEEEEEEGAWGGGGKGGGGCGVVPFPPVGPDQKDQSHTQKKKKPNKPGASDPGGGRPRRAVRPVCGCTGLRLTACLSALQLCLQRRQNSHTATTASDRLFQNKLPLTVP